MTRSQNSFRAVSSHMHEIWRVAFRFVLPGFMKMPLEATDWYIGPFRVRVLANVTLGKIPINRLLVLDVTRRPGALTVPII